MIRIFKVVILFQIFFVLQLFAQSGMQSVELNANNIKNVPLSLLKNVSIHLEDAPLQVALNEISEKGAVKLSYNRATLPLESEISIDAENVATIEVLLDVLEQSSSRLQITKSGSLIILPAKKEVPTGKIKGTVVDANSGDPLIGANVIIEGTSIGAAANIDGEFVLASMEPGEYTLKISYVGYKNKTVKVTVVSNRATKVNINLSWIAVEGKEVVVTAQAKGQLAAINDQLSSNEIKNVVSKDKIRELPDANAAESVGRLPGISLARSGGEGYGVIIRGLQPKYSKIMVDGVALSATGSNDRTVSMSSISSYSLEGIEVIKSPTADMDGDQVGGSVNLIMRTAPKGFKAEIITEGGYRGLRDEFSEYNFVANASNRFLDDKLGVFAQIIADGKDMGSNRMGAGYTQKSQVDSIVNPLNLASVNLVNNFSYRKRYGGTLTLDYLLPNGKIYAKNFFSSSFSNSQGYGEYFGTSNHEFTVTDSLSERLMLSNVIGYEQYLSIFKVSAKLSHTYTSGQTPKGIDFNFFYGSDMNPFSPDISPKEIPDYAKNKFDKFNWQDAYVYSTENSGRQLMGKLDLETDYSISKQITGKFKFGGKFLYNERSYDREKYRSGIQYSSAIFTNALIDRIPEFNQLPQGTTTFPYPLFFDKDFSHGDFINDEFNLGPVANIEQLRRIIDVLEDVEKDNKGVDGYRYQQFSSAIGDYSGIERLGAGYIMTELNITKNLTFIPGIRYEHKTTSYSGVYGSARGLAELGFNGKDTTSVRDNDFLLPMIHLKYEPTDWLQVRLAYTKTLARPNFTDILPNMYFTDEYISMRNPNLRPELAESYDMYFSFSSNYLGLLTIGGFWKNIQDKIFSRGNRILLNPEEYNLDSTKYAGFKYSTQENNEAVSITKGIEVDWQTNFWYLPSFLKGFVLNINYTKIFSETIYPKFRIKRTGPPWNPVETVIDESFEDRLIGQPNNILNVAIGYDYKDFSARLSMNYTSNIFESTNFWKEYRSFSDELILWDLRIKQKLPWFGLQLYANFANLTGSIEKTHFYAGQSRSQNYYGQSANIGLIWRMENNN